MTVALLPALGAAQTGPSFDCAKATTAVEHAICASPDLSALDRSLATSYREARDLGGDTVRDAQRQWLAERDACGSDAACLANAITDRIAVLQGSGTAPTGHDYFGIWDPVSAPGIPAGRMTISASALSFENGGSYALQPVAQGSDVYRISIAAGADNLGCGNEPIAYVSFQQYEAGKLVFREFWDRGIPPEPRTADPFGRLGGGCSMTYYER